MKSSAVFIALEYVAGFAFAILAINYLPVGENVSIIDSIFYSLLAGIVAMFIGVCLVGYFHMRAKHTLDKYGKAILLSIAGVILFIFIAILIGNFLPARIGLAIFILPLTGAVTGFNFYATPRG